MLEEKKKCNERRLGVATDEMEEPAIDEIDRASSPPQERFIEEERNNG